METTLIALVILNVFARERKDAWVIIEEKAFRWLNSVYQTNWQAIVAEAVANF